MSLERIVGEKIRYSREKEALMQRKK